MKWHKPKQTRKGHLPVQIAFDRRVREYIAAELTKSPHVEEGGKYVGYLLPEGSSQLGALRLDHDRPALVVTDFLPSGPMAVRTAVELLPDGEYQERLFRQLEQVDPEIEHVGTWHSHHCNGLQTLSGGDVDGYHRTVNKRAYRLDYFLASLVKRLPRDADDVNWIDHFLFVRGLQEYHRITDLIQIVELPTRFGRLIDHWSRSAAASEPHPREEPSEAALPDRDDGPWHETEEGRRILAEDKQSFAARFQDGVVSTRRGGVITMTGRLGNTHISATYPAAHAESQVVVNVKHDGAAILQISAGLRWRQLAFTAALLAAESLQPDAAGPTV
jgi:hypothetical protein